MKDITRSGRPRKVTGSFSIWRRFSIKRSRVRSKFFERTDYKNALFQKTSVRKGWLERLTKAGAQWENGTWTAQVSKGCGWAKCVHLSIRNKKQKTKRCTKTQYSVTLAVVWKCYSSKSQNSDIWIQWQNKKVKQMLFSVILQHDVMRQHHKKVQTRLKVVFKKSSVKRFELGCIPKII